MQRVHDALLKNVRTLHFSPFFIYSALNGVVVIVSFFLFTTIRDRNNDENCLSPSLPLSLSLPSNTSYADNKQTIDSLERSRPEIVKAVGRCWIANERATSCMDHAFELNNVQKYKNLKGETMGKK